MVRMRKLLSVLIALSMLLSCAPAVLAEAETVTIIHSGTSDLHGSIASYDYAVDAPTANHRFGPGGLGGQSRAGKRPRPAVAGLRRFHPGQHDLPV